ncbi:MAG TPA: IS110 family transposase [Streptosporangiaceae bacterium]|nr:IS110 family transposase [Streptosporangiaceae bacterium]HEV2373724.1 IS110 family transposase [Streptosporangiaceae bacterium]
MSKPQVVEDQEHKRTYERVAAVDVAKASGVVCVRGPHPSRPGARASTVWTVQATMNAVTGLAAQLAAEGTQKVTLESTSEYWRIWFYLLEAAGLDVQLVSASQARQLSGRPKTDRLDAMWLARLTENGMLRPSFVPPAEVRVLRHYARARTHLVQDRTRCWQRLEKLLEDALIKVSAVASKLTTLSAQDMIKAMIAGERDPQALARLARTRMRAKHDALVEALTGMFADHHAETAQLLLDQIAFCDTRIARLTLLIEEQTATIPAAWGADGDGVTGTAAGTGPDAAALPAVTRLEEIPGISAGLARSIIAETGLDMTRFPTAGHLVAWAGLCPQTLQSGPRTRHGKGHGNTYLRGYLGQAATGAAKTRTFLGERYHRIARRRGKAKAQVAVARSILVIIWHLLNDRGTRYRDLGPAWHETQTSKNHKARSHIRQLQALGYTVTLTPAA